MIEESQEHIKVLDPDVDPDDGVGMRNIVWEAREEAISKSLLMLVLELAAKIYIPNNSNTTLPEITAILYDDKNNTEAATVRELALKFTESPFEYREEEERFFQLETILSDKIAVFGSMTKLYNYIKRKLTCFERVSVAERENNFIELKNKLRGEKGKLLKDVMIAKGVDDFCYFYDFIMAFTLIDTSILRKHKFAFIVDRLKDDKMDKVVNIHRSLTLAALFENTN